MTRSIGRCTWDARAERDTAAKGADITNGGASEAISCWSTSEGVGAGGAGADGALGGSQTHCKQWHPGASGGALGFSVRSTEVLSAQQDDFAPVPRVGAQQDRFAATD